MARDMNKDEKQFEETIVKIRRVAKTVKGGRNMRFSVTMVVGDGQGLVGVGKGKAREIPEAARKAGMDAKKNLVRIPTVGTTIPHEQLGTFGAGKVLLMPASEGTGVIAGGSVRLILEHAGINDVRAKSIGSNNAFNAAYATIDAIKKLKTKKMMAGLRGKDEKEIL
jgi:small subunit ribosomal protein S5